LRASDVKRTICTMQDDTDSLVKSIMQRIQLDRDNMDYDQLPALTREH